jgi:hypothetical protein
MQDQRDMKWDGLKTYLSFEAFKMLREPLLEGKDAYVAVKEFTCFARPWWQGVLEIDGRSRKRIDSAIRRFIRTGCWPPLPNAERYVISLRLRLAGRIARSLHGLASARHQAWFPATIRALPHKDILRWLLIDAWDLFAAEIFDESVEWADQVGGILHAARHLYPPPAADSCSGDIRPDMN